MWSCIDSGKSGLRCIVRFMSASAVMCVEWYVSCEATWYMCFGVPLCRVLGRRGMRDKSGIRRKGTVWQQGPASFNITAKTDVCTLPINMPKVIIVYVTYYCLKLSNISTIMATGSGQHGKHCSLSTTELRAGYNYYKIPFSHINYYLQSMSSSCQKEQHIHDSE